MKSDKSVPEIPPDQPDIESERLLLRKLRIEDAEDMFEWASDEEVTKYLSWSTHMSIDESRRYLNTVLEAYDRHEFAGWGVELKEEKKLVGGLRLHQWEKEHRNADIGYVMNPGFQRRGIMTEAVRAFIQFGFEQLNLNRIEARCFVENVSSEHVMKKVGMSLEGTLRQHRFIKGRFRSLRVYSILREEYETKI